MNGLSVSGQTSDKNLQIEIEFKPKVKNLKLIFIPVRDTIKHSLESPKPGSSRVTINV